MAESLVELATREGQNIIAQAITQSSIVVTNAERAEEAADRAEEAMARAQSAGSSSETAKREAVESAEQATLIYNSFLQQYGYPFTAATAADMTDTSKIYVYVGNEAGYVNGNWYYNNGTAWVSGGTFNATAVQTDTTLSVAGKPADAKATGDAVKKTNAEMSLFGVDDLLWDNANFATNWTHNGITYTVDKINKTVTISGTATNTSVLVFYNNTIPAWLTAGKTYYAHLNTDKNVFIQVMETVNSTQKTILSAKDYGEFKLNASATNVIIRLTVNSGTTVNTMVRPFISENLSLGEFKKSETYREGKYVAFGDSIIQGAVWPATQGQSFFVADKKYQIPTRIARLTGFKNFENLGVGGSGYLREIGGETITSKILNYDFSGVELITVLGGPNDIANGYEIGSADSLPGDGTVCGAVKQIINHIYTNYPKVQLVFMGCTRARIVKAYGLFDKELKQICADNHVGFVSWDESSYCAHFNTNSGGYNGDTGPNYAHPLVEEDYALLGDFIGGKIAALYNTFVEDDKTQHTLPSVVANIQPSVEWLDNTAVSDTTGELFPTTYNYSTTKNKIEIPAGSKAYIHLLGDIFIATYDKNGDFIERVSRSNEVDYELDSADIGYFRLQCASLSQSEIESVFRLRFVYSNGNVSHAEDIQDAENGTVQTITSSGNPVVLKNTSASPFDAISISGQTANDNIVVCGKNLFTFYYERVGLVTGGTTYRFDKDSGSIRVTSEGATSTGVSANSQLGEDFHYVNNVEWYNNFKFRFASDTYVAIHGHCSVHQTYDYPVQLQVGDGTHTWRVREDGIVIKALAGVEYGVRIVTRAGFSGDITFYPQVEVGTRPTDYEVYSGSKAVVPTTAGTTNIVDITPAEAIVYKINNTYANVTTVFDRLHREVVLTGKTLTSSAVMVATQTGSINGIELGYISTVNGTGGVMCFKAIPPSMRGKAYAQITDGTTFWRDNGYGVLLNTDVSKTYAFRIFLNGNTEFDNVVFPFVVATETEALKLVDSRLDTTTIYTNDNSTINVTATQTTRVEKVEASYDVAKSIATITAGKIANPLANLSRNKAMITFIDDDTSSVALVQRYHDIFANKGVVGNYAVMTKNLDEQSGLTDLLLDYEEEGFGCLYHCYYQSGDATRYWEANNPAYDETLIKENFMRGLRSMREYGFSNYNMWVTPYGVNDKFIVDLAKNHGMRCLFNCPTVNFGEYGYISAGGFANRWNIPRPIMTGTGADPAQDAQLHSIIDACVADKGWLTIVTHANSWGSGTGMDTRLADMIQYCIDAGAEVTSVPIAFETFYPVFLLSELL